MKKAVAIVLCLFLACMGAVSSLAVWNAGANSEAPKMSVQKATQAWQPDGVINDGEYYAFTPDASMFSFVETNADSSNTDTSNAEKVQFKTYASYDDSYFYFAVDVDITSLPFGFVQDQGDNPGNMWQDQAVQFCAAPATTDAPGSADSDRTEYGFGLTSDTNTQIFTSWAEYSGQVAALDAQAGTDYSVTKNGNDLIYEIRMPWGAFLPANITTGGAFGFCFVVSAGDQASDGGTLLHIQFAQGCTGDPGKDASLFGQISLEAAPVATTTAAPDTTAAPGDTAVATTAPSTAAPTGDNSTLFVILAIASVVVLGGVVVVARKARG